MPITITCLDCNQRRPHWARGRCHPCVRKYYVARMTADEREKYLKTRTEAERDRRARAVPAICVSCGLFKDIRTKGMCSKCYFQDWMKRNPGKLAERKRAYYAEHREQHYAGLRRTAARHPNTRKESARKRYAKNLLENRERGRFKVQMRRGIDRNSPDALTPEQWNAIKAVFHDKCAYCGCTPDEITQDHVIPITKGGTYTMHNIVPACRPCNSGKGNRWPTRPVQLVLI